MNEELGDDLDAITVDMLGEAEYAATDDKNTVITTIEDLGENVAERIDQVSKLVADEKNGFIKKKLEQRLSMLSGSVGIIKVGADSKVELKEKKDRVEDAIYATKAALKEGIVPGGGIALFNASQKIPTDSVGEKILLDAIQSPFKTIMQNAGLDPQTSVDEGMGIDVVTGRSVNMVEAGIIDPVLVTKSALKNAVSVVMTIVSADCVISNVRADESN
jgi:chaperonin GroEL